MSHWSDSVIDRMSSRSLIFVDGDGSDDDDAFIGSKVSRKSTLKIPPPRELGNSSFRSERRGSGAVVGHGSYGAAETHMTNTSPKGISSSPTRRGPRNYIPPPQQTQKRRQSNEKSGTRDNNVAPVGARLKNKLRIARSKTNGPSGPVAAKPSTNQIFHASFPPHVAFHSENFNHVPVTNDRRSPERESLPNLPPQSSRAASERRSKQGSRSKQRKLRRHSHHM